MPEIKNICLIDVSPLLREGFKEAGCTVLDLRASPEQLFSLPEALAEHDFSPDLVFQAEALGTRSLVTGLDSVDCPVMFWCLDPHLNAYWHSAYGRLFDTVCSTQRSWIPHLQEQGAVDVRWLPWFGTDQPWTEMADRTHDMTFVGRITPQRPARMWMVDFLREKSSGYRLSIEQDLKYLDMLALYRDSKIIPNESIFGEVNFRLFEAASCGCLVLNQDLGEEQAELFEPGREMDTYAHVVEMGEKLDRYLGNDRLVQAMGRAAHERIQTEHLPVHRARRILEYAADSTSNRARGTDSDKWTALTMCTMWEAGKLKIPVSDVLSRLASLEQDSDVAVAVLRLQCAAGKQDLAWRNVQTLLANGLFEDAPEVNLAGAMTCLRQDRFNEARAFWYRHLKATGARDRQQPSDATALLTLWARDLNRQGRTIRAGFAFDPKQHLPAAAFDCLATILATQPEHLPTLRLLDTIFRPLSGMEQKRIGPLSILTLNERKDWRLGLEIALANLKSYRLESGLEELQLAREVARSQGQDSAFDRVLKARDASGLLMTHLS